ncbi:MAG: hypothetical protein FJZ01_16795 [Candidatus Sericytochromatia bacterium]|nr:hypothetical protein [Candidatus Tanganyikabacteria bacterium]
MPRSAWLAVAMLAAGGCAQPPVAVEPQPWRQVAQFGQPQSPQAQQPQQQQQQGSPFQDLARNHPQLRPQIGRLEARLQRLTELQGKALAAAMWNEIKDRTMDQVRLLHKSWREQPERFLAHWETMLGMVENQTRQALQELAAQLPPDMAEQPQGSTPGM